MQYLRSCCFTFLCLSLPVLTSCTANVVAPVPLELALASCSRTADPAHMVPDRLTLPTSNWRYRIGEVRVLGPTWQDNPPPISASELRTALRRAVRQAGLSGGRSPSSHLPRYILLAQIISQQRLGTYQNSRERLVVYYSLIPQNAPDLIMRNVTISTVADIHDWAGDPCARLCELQEKLARDSIRHMFEELIDSQG